MSPWYDKEGNPIDGARWRELFSDLAYRNVAEDVIEGAAISTLWHGVHRNVTGAPLVFETMVTGGEYDQHLERYATEAEARAGHARFVALVRGDA